jgi:predicted nuclease of predicted toxin-antitoxin system
VYRQLKAAGYDVEWVGEWPGDPGDEAILARAYRERRILVTLDNDFGELAIARGQRHSGILRLANLATRRQAAVCAHVLSLHGATLQSGAMITAAPGRLRIRRPESR